MALVYDGTGGIFTRLGALIYFQNAVRTHQANMKTLLANVQTEYVAADAYMIEQLNGMIEARIADAGSVLNDIVASSERTVIEMCWTQAQSSTNNPMPTRDIESALRWLIRQMDLDGETIKRNIVSTSSTGAAAANNGNGSFVYSPKQPASVTATPTWFPNIRTEIMEARCIADAQGGAMTAGSELFRISGGFAYPILDYRAPGGSGVLMDINSITASVDDGPRGQNILVNSDLEDWTSNVPDQFTVSTGTAGTTFLRESTVVARQTYSMKAAVTGGLFKLRQQLGSSSGTLGRLVPDTCYTLGALYKKDAGATGSLRLALEDSGGTAIVDAESLPNIASLSSSTWTLVSAQFRTPKILPTTTYLSISSTIAVATAAVYIDEIFVAELMSVAPGGQSVGVICNSSNWTLDDQVYTVFANDVAGGFATGLDYLFNLFNRGLTLPTAVSTTETISDTLIA
jgi:hypothetical protein